MLGVEGAQGERFLMDALRPQDLAAMLTELHGDLPLGLGGPGRAVQGRHGKETVVPGGGDVAVFPASGGHVPDGVAVAEMIAVGGRPVVGKVARVLLADVDAALAPVDLDGVVGGDGKPLFRQ